MSTGPYFEKAVKPASAGSDVGLAGAFGKVQDDHDPLDTEPNPNPRFLSRSTSTHSGTSRGFSVRRALVALAAIGLWATSIYHFRGETRWRSDVQTGSGWSGSEDSDLIPWVFADEHTCSDDLHTDVKKKKKKRRHGRKHLNGKKAERIFLSVPNPESAETTSRLFASKPHIAGSQEDLATTVDLLHSLQTELGIDRPEDEPIFNAGSSESRRATLSITNACSSHKPRVWVDTYYPILNTPGERSVDLLSKDGDVVWTANLTEDGERILDPVPGKYAASLSAFHAYSHDGDVQGKLVFANYGREEDFKVLDRLGVNLTGSIVVARYGYNFRGLKIKQAEDRGAAGCLLYNDPRDDGTVNGDNGYAVYPFGPARNPTSYERGSVQYISIYPGDPTTPGYPSYMNSNRADPANVPKIPSLPISWSNAQRLLQEIEKGGGNRTVRLVNRVKEKVSPIWNVMAVIPGYNRDEVVVIGNHRDSWGLGTTGPVSGTASLVEVVRGLGTLSKKGWKPIRTIVIASWDAGEYGLIGSTEWGEDFAHWIKKHVVAYLNVDSSAGGSRFTISSSASLGHMLVDAAKEIPHPTDVNRTLWDARYDVGPYWGHMKVDTEAMEAYGGGRDEHEEGYLRVGSLGSGSDYAVFLHHLGIASSSGSFEQTLTDAPRPYNSVFDTHVWLERYGDKGYHHHVAVSQFFGLQLLRLADATVLPFNTTHYTSMLSSYLGYVHHLAYMMNIEVDLSSLRKSLTHLYHSSHSLDREKVDAEEELVKLMAEWAKLKQREGWLSKKLRKLIDWLRDRFGRHPCRDSEGDMDDFDELELVVKELPRLGANGLMQPRIGRAPAWAREQQDKDKHDDVVEDSKHKHKKHKHKKRHWGERRKLLKRLYRAAARVRCANAKLIGFERGLTNGDGLKGREWYKHLGVAPGKWEGYSSTVFPGLTEAITLDKNATLAAYEVERLVKVMDKLAHSLKS